MAQKKKPDDSYEKFAASVKAGSFGNLYIFHGEERYLLEHSVAELRRHLCPDGLDGFNYKRFEGKDIRIADLNDAIDTFPVFADKTLIEAHDFDLFKGKEKLSEETGISESRATGKSSKGGKGAKTETNAEKQQLADILSDLPDYVCIVFIYDTLQYKPDGRQKLDKAILDNARVVEFTIQEQAKLTNWIRRRFEATGKHIDRADAEYLALITDGHMAALVGEIEKVAAYSDSETINRSDIDAVVTPVINAFAYKLTDAILTRRHKEAMRILDELLLMREPAQKILYSISLKMRQFLAARICLDDGMDKADLMEMCGIRFDFQAAILLDTARKTTLSNCRDAVLLCSQAAFDLNSAPEPEARLIELLTKIAFNSGIRD